jgi:tetratricopeptide (TPR) repeat protein
MKLAKFKLLTLLVLTSPVLFAQTLQEGVQAIDYDKFEQAKNIFTHLTQKEPANGLNFYYLGIAQINLFNPAAARQAFNSGIAADANQPANYAGLGRLLLDEGKTTEARAQFDKALSISRDKSGRVKDVNAVIVVAAAMISSDNKLIDDAIKLVDAAMENEKKPNYDLLVVAGDVYLEKNEAGKAASLYEKAIALQDKNPKAYVRVSEIWLRVRNAEATRTELERALNINKDYAPALKAQAEYFYLTRQFDKAKATYEKYLSNSEASLANKQRFARMLFRAKDYQNALQLIDEIFAADKSDLYLYRLKGYSMFELGNDEKDTILAPKLIKGSIDALNTFLDKIAADKVIGSDYEYLGKAYTKLGNDSLAILNFNKAVEVDPSKVELYREAGLAFYKMKKMEEAAKFLSLFVQSGKANLVDYQILGLSSIYSGQYAKGDEAFAAILNQKADYADGYYWRGVANASLDPDYKQETAKNNYEQFIALAESTPDKNKSKLISSYEYMGSYYIYKDQNKLAKEYYNKILALDPNNKKAVDVLKQIK